VRGTGRGDSGTVTTMDAPQPTLRQQAADALRARTCVVAMGLPGSGRRFLAARAHAALADEGWRMLRLTGAGPRPLDALSLAGFLPSAPGRVFGLAAGAEALTDAAGAGPAMLLVDDGDDLDDVSATVIASVMDRADLTVFATCRPPLTGDQAIVTMLARRDSTILRPGPVPFDELQRIVGDVAAAELDPGTAGRIYALSGGLPGLARAITAEARRAGRLILVNGLWRAASELWSPGLDMVVARLTHGLSDDERHALGLLAELGPAPAASAQQLVAASVLVRLEDRGLLHVAAAGGAPLVALFPPLLAESFRQRSAGIRGMQSAKAVAGSLETPVREAPAAAPAPATSETSAETATIIGRLLREQLAAELATARSHWEHVPSDAAALAYVSAMLTSGAGAARIDAVLRQAKTLPMRDPAERVELRAWEATYLAFVRHDLAAASALIDETIAAMPESATALRAIHAYLSLITGHRSDLPGYPVSEGERRTLGLGPQSAEDVVATVRGEILLASGRAEDALAEFARRRGIDPLRADRDALIPLAHLVAGDLDTAMRDAGRQLDLACGTLHRAAIKPYGYVVALGLYVRGRLASLRNHLTAMFAANAVVPLRPAPHAALLSLGAEIALIDGTPGSARSLIDEARSWGLPGGHLPLGRVETARAALGILQGRSAVDATRAAWEAIDSLLSEGLVLAALLDGARLVDLHVDEARTARLSELARGAQGRLMPLLADYLQAAMERSPDRLITTAEALWANDLRLHATRARVMAIRLLRERAQADRATAESARLQALVRAAGDDLHLLVPSSTAPAAELTEREREIATLIAGGMTNRAVARRLRVSDRTVDNHVYRIFRKLGITSREEIPVLL
jgi:DNA-binding CsgD family transcriptional regulator